MYLLIFMIIIKLSVLYATLKIWFRKFNMKFVPMIHLFGDGECAPGYWFYPSCVLFSISKILDKFLY